jgi:hypothetical protein
MRRLMALLLLLAAGCSTAPLADVLDFVKPGRLVSNPTRIYGGVSAPNVSQPVEWPAPALPAPPAPPPSGPFPIPPPPPGIVTPPGTAGMP